MPTEQDKSSGRVLVTGASGFIGRPLCDAMAASGTPVRAAQRLLPTRKYESETADSASAGGILPEFVEVGEIGPDTIWDPSLDGCETVIHLAGVAHVMRGGQRPGMPDQYHRINTEGTLHLAACAARSGIRRIVFVSSILVHGSSTQGAPLNENSPVRTETPYARSKWEAEQHLWCIARDTGLEVVVVRPSLVYGPGVKGNFLRLLQWINSGIPLPLRNVHNQRHMTSLASLVNMLLMCTNHPKAAGRTYLAADAESFSTPQLIQRLAECMRRPARLYGVPSPILVTASRIPGLGGAIRRLTESMEVDASRGRTELGYNLAAPNQTLAKTVEWYLRTVQSPQK